MKFISDEKKKKKNLIGGVQSGRNYKDNKKNMHEKEIDEEYS